MIRFWNQRLNHLFLDFSGKFFFHEVEWGFALTETGKRRLSLEIPQDFLVTVFDSLGVKNNGNPHLAFAEFFKMGLHVLC